MCVFVSIRPGVGLSDITGQFQPPTTPAALHPPRPPHVLPPGSRNYPFHNVFNPMIAALFSGNAQLADPVSAHMSAALPMIGAGEAIKVAVAALEAADAAVVVDDGKPTGVITRQDVLGYLSK